MRFVASVLQLTALILIPVSVVVLTGSVGWMLVSAIGPLWLIGRELDPDVRGGKRE